MSSELPGYEQAAAMVREHGRRIGKERPAGVDRVKLAEAAGRVLATEIIADDDQPPFARSTRDGFAGRAAEISSHNPLPIAGATRAGESPAGPLPGSAVWEIMTGAEVPEGADCVVMLEHVERSGGAIRLLAPHSIARGDNIVPKGAQSRRGSIALHAGVLLGPAQLALAAFSGSPTLQVHARPRVAILTTGDELVPIEQAPGPGKIRNSNAPMLEALVARAGGEPMVLPASADTAEALDGALAGTLDADLILISGGVSAGKFDLVEPALARLGAIFHFTGVKIQPGKPLVFGEIPRRGESGPGRFFFGLPGNPISTAVTFLLFAAPLLEVMAGRRDPGPHFIAARLSSDTDRRGKSGLTRFLPAFCRFPSAPGELPEVALVPWHGSGDLTSFARSNCLLVIAEDAAWLEAGSSVPILLH